MSSKDLIPDCPRCQVKKHVLLRYQVTSNNINQYFWWCSRCEKRINCESLPHKEIKKMRLPPEFWVRGLFKDKHKDVQCVVCGNYGAELHHFAPQSLAKHFGENWPKWPTANLCRPCHELWHSVVTPHMYGVRQLQGEG